MLVPTMDSTCAKPSALIEESDASLARINIGTTPEYLQYSNSVVNSLCHHRMPHVTFLSTRYSAYCLVPTRYLMTTR
jgi:hypothetical protein